MISEKHVNALTANFFAHNLPDYGFSTRYNSSPYEHELRTIENDPHLDGDELLVVAELKK